VAAKGWNERYRNEQTYLQEGPVLLVRQFFERYSDQLGRGPILDVGCGNGRNLQESARRGYPTFGIDVSGEALAQLERRLRRLNLSADVRFGTFRTLPYADASFAGVLAINVFQHNDWAGAVRSFAEVGRVLARNGLFLLRVRSASRPLDHDPQVLVDDGVTYIPHGGTKSGITLHHYSEEELRDLAAANALVVVELDETVREDVLDRRDRWSWVGVFRKEA
jgi:SAM-dependent methyltransferase